MAEPTKPGFNIGLALNTLVAALILALILGAVGVYNDNSNNKEKIIILASENKKLRDDFEELKDDFIREKIANNAKFATVDNIKEGVERIEKKIDKR